MSPWQYLLHSKRSFYEFYLQFLKYQKKKKTIYYTQSEKEIWTPCRVCSLDSRRTEILRSLSWFGYSSGLLSFKKPETVLWTIAKHYYYYYYYRGETIQGRIIFMELQFICCNKMFRLLQNCYEKFNAMIINNYFRK